MTLVGRRVVLAPRSNTRWSSELRYGPRRWRERALAALVTLTLLCMTSGARGEGRVTLLQPTPASTMDWPPAVRAAIAELALAGFEVNVKRTPLRDLSQLVNQLHEETLHARIVAALLIVRSQERGAGHVWMAGAQAPIVVSEASPDAPISQSSLALKLADLLRERHLHLPPQAPPAAYQKVEALPDDHQPEPDSELPSVIGPRIGLGMARSSGASAPVGNLGVRLNLLEGFQFSLDARRSLDGLDVNTGAGVASVAWTGGFSSLLYHPVSRGGFEAAAGVGWGAVWVRSRAAADPGYVGRDASATTSIAAAVLQLGYRSDPWRVDLVFEPGVMFPRLRVLAQGSELVSLGRPWLNLFAMVTWGA